MAWLVGTGFGSGLSPVAPGTAGTLAAAVVVALLSHTSLPAQATLISLAVLATVGCLAAGRRVEGMAGAKDPGCFVLDEFAGFFVALSLPGAAWPRLGEVVVAFLLFRLFDIIKPPPARNLQRLTGGLGIVADDLAAGLYALVGTLVYRDVMQNPPW